MKNSYRFIKKVNSRYSTLVEHRVNMDNIKKYLGENDIQTLKQILLDDFSKVIDTYILK